LQGVDRRVQAGADHGSQLAKVLAPLLRGFHNNLDVIPVSERFVRVGGSAGSVQNIGTNLPPFSDRAHRTGKNAASFSTCSALTTLDPLMQIKLSFNCRSLA
jgi:hypothetical protein